MSVILAAAALLQFQDQVREEAKDWRLLRTEQFDVYYPSDDMEERARHFAGLFEDARGRLEKSCGAVLKRRVRIFLYRSVHDLASSSANARPRPIHPALRGREAAPAPSRPCCRLAQSRAFAFAEPLQDRIFLHCQGSDRWNAWFVRHELVHQLQFQEIFPTRIPSWTIATNDGIIPQWFWEGFADYGAGIFDSEKDEYVRDLLEEHLYDLKELFDGYPLNAHDYIAVYYEGSMFFRFLEEAYGPGTAAKVFQSYARRFPLTMGKILRQALGRDREELEAAFKTWIETLYAARMTGRTAPNERVTDTRSYYRILTGAGRWSPDGKHLAYSSIKDVEPEIYVDEKGLLGLRRLFQVEGLHSPPSWSPDSRRLVLAGWWKNRDYLIFCDLNGGVEDVLLDFDEVTDPAWSPNGEDIVFAGLKHGTADLYCYNLKDRTVVRLTEDTNDDRHPAWSPDGRKLVWIHETDGRTELVMLDIATKTRAVAAKTLAQMDRPLWTPDGKALVVSADVDGVYDAFLVDAVTGKASRLTRFRGGVHFPQVAPDGKTLLFTYFERRGTDLFTVAMNPQEEPRFGQEDRAPWYEQFRPVPPRGERAIKERKWALDWLMFPVIGESLVIPGLQIEVADLDAENTVYLQGVFLGPRSWEAIFSVVNTRYRPTLGVEAIYARDQEFTSFAAGPFVEYPLIPGISTSVGWLARHSRTDLDDAPDDAATDSGPSVSLSVRRQSGWLIFDPSWGFSAHVQASFFKESFGGDRTLAEYGASLEYSYAVLQDLIVWTRGTGLKKVGPLLEDEPYEIEMAVRGADFFEGSELGSGKIELRFPLVRDLLFMPMELVGLGEYLLLKDLRGFGFADVGFVGGGGDTHRAYSGGVGLRVDLFVLLWPLTTIRAPLRLEVWRAWGRQDEDPPYDSINATGISISLPY
ncbi:MAG: PD40 domain-containing protein [Planctomycetes bacterium]|nr:PD40 domain-containing protein [Planctomycetota bacterium]